MSYSYDVGTEIVCIWNIIFCFLDGYQGRFYEYGN